MIDQYFTNLSRIVQPVISIWFIVWAYRHSYELDEKLDSVAKRIRWLIVLVCYAVAAIPTSVTPIIYIRPPLVLIGLAFLAWPNFAYRLRKRMAFPRDPTKQT